MNGNIHSGSLSLRRIPIIKEKMQGKKEGGIGVGTICFENRFVC
jgi:hypothetical protein